MVNYDLASGATAQHTKHNDEYDLMPSRRHTNTNMIPKERINGKKDYWQQTRMTSTNTWDHDAWNRRLRRPIPCITA